MKILNASLRLKLTQSLQYMLMIRDSTIFTLQGELFPTRIQQENCLRHLSLCVLNGDHWHAAPNNTWTLQKGEKIFNPININ